jgi:hypothetical protein
MKTPTGWALVVDGWTPGDVIFSHKLGVFNVTRTRQFAVENPLICGPFRVTVPPISLLERDPAVDKAKALAIPLNAATADPLLCIQMLSRHLLVLDGHHRLFRMISAGITVFQSYIVPPAFQPPLVASQTRRLADCTDDQLASQIIAKDLLLRILPRSPHD